MEPVISPWTIFWLQVLVNIDGFNHVVFPLIMILDFFWVWYILDRKFILSKYDSYTEAMGSKSIETNKSYLEVESDINFASKFKYPLLVVTIISFLCMILIPSKEMLIAIVASNYITTDNINMANELFKSNLNDYVNIIANAFKR